MINETIVTMVGNLVEDPKQRTTESGIDLAVFRLASTARRFDAQAGRHVDAGSLFLSVTCWRALAGNVAASLRKGDPVVVTGRLFTRSYEKDGQTRSVVEMEAHAVGPDLARGTAVFRRTPRGPGGEGGESGEGGTAVTAGGADPADRSERELAAV
jgi:single-strand DNA-binding protein